MKRMISILLAMSLLVGAGALTACKKKDGGGASLTRGEWITLLADKYSINSAPDGLDSVFDDVKRTNEYYDAVQGTAAWEIIAGPGDFKPDDNATNEFAVVTAVKAIGLSLLDESEYRAELDTDAGIVEFFETQSGLSLKAAQTLTAGQAASILEAADGISAEMTFPQVAYFDYKENARELSVDQVTFSADGVSGTLRTGTAQVGDIIVVAPSVYMPEGKSAKITSVNGSSFTYVLPELEEIVNDYTISGTYAPQIYGFIPATSGVTVESIEGMPATTAYKSAGSGSDMFAAKPMLGIDETFNINGKINLSIDIKPIEGLSVTGKISVSLNSLSILAKAGDGEDEFVKLKTTLTSSVQIKVGSAVLKNEVEFPLGKVPYGIPGANFSINVSVKIGAEGTLSISEKLETNTEFRAKGAGFLNLGRKFSLKANENSTLEVSAEAKGYIRPDLDLKIKVCGIDIGSVGVYGGVNLRAKSTRNADGSFCLDIGYWVPLVFYAKFDLGVVAGKVELELLNEKNSTVKGNLHIEDGKIVPECTRKGKTDPAASSVDENDDFGELDG
ncbi:MAG: S-layer homology domain-containing protein, partial [Oscillospiraceae bacterium]|nr:S-layer homology domain-containing protein [Oscillospiraceae bacterium]